MIGSFGGGNLGDNAVLDTIVQLINEKYSNYNYRLYIPTSNIKYIKEKYKDNKNIIPININIRTGALRFTSIQTFLCLRKVEKIFTTAGILFDYNANKFLTQSFITSLIPLFTIAKLLKKEIIGLNVGVVQKSRIGKFLLRYILKRHDIIYLREPADETILNRLKINTKRINSADIVFMNETIGLSKFNNTIYKPVIGVNLNKYLDIQANNIRKVNYNEFIRIIAMNLDQIIDRNSASIKFLSTSKMDDQIHLDVKSLMVNKDDVHFPSCNDYEDLLKEVSKVNVLIGMRMHSLIFATLQGKPVCSLNYNPKVTNFMKQLRLANYSHEIYQLDNNKIFNSIEEILGEYDYYCKIQNENRNALKEKAKLSVSSL